MIGSTQVRAFIGLFVSMAGHGDIFAYIVWTLFWYGDGEYMQRIADQVAGSDTWEILQQEDRRAKRNRWPIVGFVKDGMEGKPGIAMIFGIGKEVAYDPDAS